MPDNGVEIDTGQVDEYAKGLRSEADSGFSQAATRGRDLHQHGVVFGARLPGDVILQAKNRYARALENTELNLREYQRAAEILANVAEQIARDFAKADRSSVEAQRRVADLLNNAIIEANRELNASRRAI